LAIILLLIFFGSYRGQYPGTINYDYATGTVTFDPQIDFLVGKRISVVVTDGINSTDGLYLQSGTGWSFIIQTKEGLGEFYDYSMMSIGGGPGDIAVSSYGSTA